MPSVGVRKILSTRLRTQDRYGVIVGTGRLVLKFRSETTFGWKGCFTSVKIGVNRE